MTPEFKKAFVDAYSRNVANVEDKEVEDFIDDFANDVSQTVLHNKYPNGYTSIMDALGVFEAGINFGRTRVLSNVIRKTI